MQACEYPTPPCQFIRPPNHSNLEK